MVASGESPAAREDAESSRVSLHSCDILDAAGLDAIVRAVVPDKVVHLAAISFAGHADVEAMYRVNVVGTRNLLASLAGSARRPDHVLLVSSGAVYGSATVGTIDEGAPLAPPNDYAVSKVAMEYMARLWMDRLPLSIVRPFNYTGSGQSVDFVIPKIADHFRRRAPVIELGNLDVERDFSDVRSVVDAYVRILNRKALNATVNVCSGRAISLRDVLRIASTLTGFTPEVRINPRFVRANDPPRLVGSPRSLEDAIGAYRVIEMRETVDWMLK